MELRIAVVRAAEFDEKAAPSYCGKESKPTIAVPLARAMLRLYWSFC